MPTVKGDDLPASAVDRLPVNIEQVADAEPATIKLAAAAIIDNDVSPDTACHRCGNAADA